MAAILVYQTNLPGDELYFYANNVFVSVKQHGRWSREWKQSTSEAENNIHYSLIFTEEIIFRDFELNAKISNNAASFL